MVQRPMELPMDIVHNSCIKILKYTYNNLPPQITIKIRVRGRGPPWGVSSRGNPRRLRYEGPGIKIGRRSLWVCASITTDPKSMLPILSHMFHGAGDSDWSELVALEETDQSTSLPTSWRVIKKMPSKRPYPNKYAISGYRSLKRRAVVPANVRSYVKRAIIQAHETKVFQLNSANLSLDPTTQCAVIELSQMDQGIEVNERIADEISPIRIKITGYLNNKDSVQTSDRLVRVVLIRTTNGQMDNVASKYLVADTGLPIAMTADDAGDINRMFDYNTLTVVADQKFVLPYVLGVDGSTKGFSFDIKLGGKMQYPTESNDARDGNLRMLVLVRNPDNGAAANGITYGYCSQFMYKDS